MPPMAPFPTDPDQPVLIAGPTASGKSSLALEIAERCGGVIVNADALQVFDGWRIVTARPSKEDEARAPHLLYGHVPFDADYSVGAWLAEVSAILNSGQRPIIVGGTGLYLTALTQGLAEIPPTPPEIRQEADQIPLPDLVAALDPETAGRIDLNNRMRVQRAYEVWISTGRSIANWQDDTPPPLLPLEKAHALVLDAPKEWLNPRIALRFDLMIADGALDEARAMLPHWTPDAQSSKAIGAPELIAHLQGTLALDDAIALAVIASQQYAKRQRTWFRSRMQSWTRVPCLSTG